MYLVCLRVRKPTRLLFFVKKMLKKDDKRKSGAKNLQDVRRASMLVKD